jgi:hypothetical protein
MTPQSGYCGDHGLFDERPAVVRGISGKVRHDPLEHGDRCRAEFIHRFTAGAVGIVCDLLVSALCLRPPAGLPRRGCTRSHAGVLHRAARQRDAAGRRSPARPVPDVSAGGRHEFSRETAAQGGRPQTRGRPRGDFPRSGRRRKTLPAELRRPASSGNSSYWRPISGAAGKPCRTQPSPASYE